METATIRTNLTEGDLKKYLLGAYYTMSDLASVAKRSGNQHDFEERRDVVLGYLFDLAVLTQWIEEPPEGNSVLGDWSVPENYRAAFYKMVCDDEKFGDNPGDGAGVALTPRAIFTDFLENEMHWRKSTFLEDYTKENEAIKKGLVSVKDSAERKFSDRHVYNNSYCTVVTTQHKRLGAYIRSHSKKYANLDDMSLLWPVPYGT